MTATSEARKRRKGDQGQEVQAKSHMPALKEPRKPRKSPDEDLGPSPNPVTDIDKEDQGVEIEDQGQGQDHERGEDLERDPYHVIAHPEEVGQDQGQGAPQGHAGTQDPQVSREPRR